MSLRRRSALLTASVVLVAAWVWHDLGLDADLLVHGWHNLAVFLGDALPPEWSVLDTAWQGLVESLQIAYLATLIGLVLSLPLAILAAHNLSPPWISAPLRTLLSAVRVPPAILWAAVFVALVGVGPLGGVLAMALYSVGYLGKLQYEAIEGLPSITLDTAHAMGMPRWQRVLYVVIPEAANVLLSQALFMFEYNVRASTIVGFVGAGGIGVAINRYLTFLAYDRVATLLVVLFFAVVAIDGLSLLVRRRYLEDRDGPRARWRDLVRTPHRGRSTS